jgi:flagellar basal body rod protein FlgG
VSHVNVNEAAEEVRRFLGLFANLAKVEEFLRDIGTAQQVVAEAHAKRDAVLREAAAAENARDQAKKEAAQERAAAIAHSKKCKDEGQGFLEQAKLREITLTRDAVLEREAAVAARQATLDAVNVEVKAAMVRLDELTRACGEAETKLANARDAQKALAELLSKG